MILADRCDVTRFEDRATAMANNAEWLVRLASHAAAAWEDQRS